MSQSFDFASNYTHTQLNGSDCSAIYLNGTRIWERYTAQRQVLVSSGYYTSSWVRIQTRGGGGSVNSTYGNYSYNFDNSGWVSYYSGTAYGGPVTSGRRNYVYTTRITFTSGNYRFSIGGYDSSASPKSTRRHGLNIDEYQTNWVDTSSYQTEDYTAYYY